MGHLKKFILFLCLFIFFLLLLIVCLEWSFYQADENVSDEICENCVRICAKEDNNFDNETESLSSKYKLMKATTPECSYGEKLSQESEDINWEILKV